MLVIFLISLFAACQAALVNATSSKLKNKLSNTVSGTYLAPCTGIRKRRDIRDLDPAERAKILGAMRDLLSGEINDMVSVHGAVTSFTPQSETNQRYWTIAHGTPFFLPWHRLYLREFEDRLQRKLGENVALPYWDWTLDSQRPYKSAIFSNDYIGSSDPNNYYIVQDSVFNYKNFQLSYPNNHALFRLQKHNVFATRPLITAQLKSRGTFSDMATYMEQRPHGIVHTTFGGINGDQFRGDMGFQYSPNDPLFWLHHAFIDKLWTEWQSIEGNMFKFDGKSYLNQPKLENIDSKAKVPRYNIQVSKILNSENICVAYSEPGSKAKALATDTLQDLKNPKPPTDVPMDWLIGNGISKEQIKKVRKESIETLKKIERNETISTPSSSATSLTLNLVIILIKLAVFY